MRALRPFLHPCLLRAVFLLLIGLCFVQKGPAQFYKGSEMSFGRKRVQYEEFFWMYYRFNGFDVYFNRKGQNLALYTANYVQHRLQEMESQIGFSAQEELKFIVFNRLSDFKQSNIGYLDEAAETGYNTGGITRFIDNKVFLYFDGDYVHFEQQIRRGMATILLTQAIQGSKVGSQYKNSYLMDLPFWFTQGLAAYFSETWSEQDDERIHQAILTKNYRYISGIEGEEAAFAGQSFWYFISKRYGADAIPRCVRIVATERSMEKTFQIALNIKFKDLMKEWYEFFLYEDLAQRDSLTHFHILKKTNRPDRIYQQFVINPGTRWEKEEFIEERAEQAERAERAERAEPKKKRKGGELAFVANRLGRACVYIQTLYPSRRRCVYRLGAAVNDMPDYSFPILRWHPNGHALGIMVEEKGRTTLVVYDLEKKKKEAMFYYLDYFEKITGFDFSPDGRSIAIAASSNGQSDIFVHNLGAGTDKQITFDLYDDANPSFVKGSDLLVFSSNRPDDTLRRGEKFEMAPSFAEGHNLFSYDLKKGGLTLFRLTQNDDRIMASMPKALDSKNLLFLTNASGKTDLALGRFGKALDKVDTAVHYRSTFKTATLTNRPPGLLMVDVSSEAGAYTTLAKEKGRFVLAIEPLPALRQEIYPKFPVSKEITPTPFKKEILDKQRRILRRKALADSMAVLLAADSSGKIKAEMEAAARAGQRIFIRCAGMEDRVELTAFDRYLQSLPASSLTEAPLAEGALTQGPLEESALGERPLEEGSGVKGGELPGAPSLQDSSTLIASRPKKKKRRRNAPPEGFILSPEEMQAARALSGGGIPGEIKGVDPVDSLGGGEDSLENKKPEKVPPKQYTYRPQFSVNSSVAQLGFSFINTTYQAFTNSSSPIYLNSNFTGLTQISLTDLMENHRIIGGFSFSFDFTTFEYLLSYEYLERRLGHQFIFHIFNRNDNSMNVLPYKQNTYDGYYVMKYPLSPVSMIKGTLFARYDRTVYKSFEINSLLEPTVQQLKVGLKAEWVYDHARFITQNIFFGTRAKAWVEYYQGIVHDNQNLFVVGFDLRDYRRLYKTLIWANRIAASTSFGQQKLVYYMGGVDGWLFPGFDRNIKTDPKQNYAYQTLATNMRGFIQNIRNGNTFVVINSEIRFPFVQVFSKGPVKSSFLRHLQLVVFGDIGSAWSNWNPWSKDNLFYKQTLVDGKITIDLEKDANPIVGGFGFGLRCQLLGYFFRGDLAWGVENGRVHNKPVFYFSLSTDF